MQQDADAGERGRVRVRVARIGPTFRIPSVPRGRREIKRTRKQREERERERERERGSPRADSRSRFVGASFFSRGKTGVRARGV